jgi:hypothetical protein
MKYTLKTIVLASTLILSFSQGFGSQGLGSEDLNPGKSLGTGVHNQQPQPSDGYGTYEQAVIKTTKVAFQVLTPLVVGVAYLNTAGVALTAAQYLVPLTVDCFLTPGILNNPWAKQCYIGAVTTELTGAARATITGVASLVAPTVLGYTGELVGKGLVYTGRGLTTVAQSTATGLSTLAQGAWNWIRGK